MHINFVFYDPALRLPIYFRKLSNLLLIKNLMWCCCFLFAISSLCLIYPTLTLNKQQHKCGKKSESSERRHLSYLSKVCFFHWKHCVFSFQLIVLKSHGSTTTDFSISCDIRSKLYRKFSSLSGIKRHAHKLCILRPCTKIAYIFQKIKQSTVN
jgi:hypothetical protein